MAQQIDIVANLLMKVDGAEAGINKLKNSLSKLKMPEGLDNSFKKSFANLDTIFAKYKSQIEKGFDTKGDVTAFNKTSKALDTELNRISKHFTELTGKPIDFKVKNENLINAERELAKLIEQKNKLTTDIKGIQFKFEGKEAARDIESLMKAIEKAAGNTKAGNFMGGALIDLDKGNISKTITQLEQAANAAQKLGDKKKAAFKDDNGTSMVAAIQKIVEELRKAEGEFLKTDAAIDEVKSGINSIRADQMQKVGQYAENAANSFEQERSALSQLNGEAQEYASSMQSMSQQLGDLQQSTQYFFSLRNMINLFRRGIDNAIQSVKELDAAMTDTAVVTDYNISDLWGMLPQYTELANELGATTQGAYETMTLYFQQGLDQQQAFEIGAETMKMARIAGLDYAETTDMMTAALRGFNMELNETSAKRVNDVYSELAAITASDTEELGKAMQRTASIAHSAGASFEGTTAFLAQAIETTREPAENIGTAMKTIIARFQEMKKNPLEISEVDGEEVDYNKIDAALKTIGVSLKDTNGQFREFDEVMLDISARWDTLSQSQQRYIAPIAAGSRQQSRFIAMVSNYDRTMELMQAANNSAGASDEQFGKTMDSLEAKINKLHNAWQQFTMGIANNGMIKLAVDGVTGLLTVTNKLIDTFSLGIGPVKSLLSLLMAFTGLKAAGRVANSMIGGLGGLLDPQSSFFKGFKGGFIKNTDSNAQAQAISNPIVQAIHQLQGALTGKIVTTNSQSNASADYKSFKTANSDLRALLKETGTEGKLSISSAYGKISKLDDKQQASILKQLPGLSLSLQKNGIQFEKRDVSAASKKLLTTFNDEINTGLKNKTLNTQTALKIFGTPEDFKQAMAARGNDYVKAAEEVLYGNGQTKNDAITKAMNEARTVDSLYGRERSDDYYKEIAEKRVLEQEKKAFENFANTAQSKGAMVANSIGNIGTVAMNAGQGIAQLGIQLSNAGFDTAGAAVTNLGYQISSLGQIAASTGSLVGKITDAGGIGGLISAHPYVAAAGVAIAAIGGIIALAKAQEKHAREAAEKTVKTYTDTINQTTEKISTLNSAKDVFGQLSKGVDQYGNNIGLTTDEYDQYLQTSQEIAQIAPELIRGYDAQGRAIIATGEAIDQLITKQEELQESARDTFVSDSSINDLVAGIRVSDAFKDNETNRFGDNLGYLQKQTGALKQALQSVGIEEFDAATKQLFGREINLVNPSTDDLRLISEHYGDIYRLIESKNSDLADKQKEGLQNAFADLGNGWNDMTKELQPLSQAIGQYLSSEGLDTIGLNLGEEFTGAFNAGLQDLTMTAAMENWDASEIKIAARDYAEGFKEMTQEGSEYANIMEKVTAAQEAYNDSIGESGAIDDYKAAVEDYAIELENLADRYDDGTVAGQLFANSLRETAGHIRNYATESVISLGEAINTLSDEFTSARGAQERFQEATKNGDYYTAAEGYKGIIDNILDEKNLAGNGSLTFWAGADELLGKNFVDNNSYDQVVKQIKKVQDCFADGSDGVLAFNDLLVANADKLKGLGYVVDGNDWHFDLQTEDLAEYAEVLGMSEEALASLIDKARQWVPMDLGDPKKIRQALEANETSMSGTSSKGENLLYTSESGFREEARQQGIRGNDYTKTKADAESQGIRFLNVENLTAKNQADDGAYANQVLENIGLKGADKTLNNAVAAFAKMGFDLEDTKQILTADGIKLADGTATAEQVEQAYNENAYAMENPTVAGIANDTGVIANAATAMLASMGILTDDAKKKIDESTSKDTIEGAKQTLNPEGGFKTTADHEAARSQIEAQIADYESTINLLKQSGNDALLPQIQQLETARDSLQQALDADTDSWQAKIEDAKSYVEGIGKTVQEQQFLDAHAFDIQQALESSDPTTLVNTLQQLQQEGSLSSQTMLDLGASLSHLEGNEVYIQALNALMSQYYENVKAARDETYKPFTITTKLEGEDLVSYISGIDDLTFKEREILVAADLYGDEKVTAFLDEINTELDGNETTKTVLIEATAKIANGDTAGANELLQGAFGDKAQEVQSKLEIICSGNVANASEVQQSIESQIDALPIETQIETNVKANVTAAYTGTAPKAQSTTVNYTKGKQDNPDKKSTTVDYTLGKQDPPKTKDAGVNYTWKSQDEPKDKTAYVTYKEKDARGRGYSIPAHNSLSFGSAAQGMNIPKKKQANGSQVTALVGEEGFEVGYIPSEQRSIIFGANGPEMTSFPSDTVIYPHKQSKDILRRGKGNHKSLGSFSGGKDSISSGGLRSSITGSSSASKITKNKQDKKNSQSISKAAKTIETVSAKAGKVFVWWENMARSVEKAQRDAEKNQKTLERLLKNFGTTLSEYDEASKPYKEALEKQIDLANQRIEKANDELHITDYGADSKKSNDYLAAIGARQEISYEITKTKKKKGKKKTTTETKKETLNLAKYITKNADGLYQLNQNEIDKVAKSNKSRAEAIKAAAEKQLNDLYSKLKSAEDDRIKAEEALQQFYNDAYAAFYRWDKSITQIYLLGQQLEKLGNLNSIYEAAVEVQTSKLEAGFGKAIEVLPQITSALEKNRDILIEQVQTNDAKMQAAWQEYNDALSLRTVTEKYLANQNSTDAAYDYDVMKNTLSFLQNAGLDKEKFNLDTAAKALEELYANQWKGDDYDKIKEGLDKIAEKQNDYYTALADTYQSMTEVYNKIEEYQSYMSDFEGTLIKGLEEQTKAEVDKLSKLNDSLSKAMQNLLDEVKRKLDERRKREDNAKTEQDISQKEQRLAALRADTAGGHATEIAQLEKEVAEARQSYGRTLEDQLLDRLSQQQDEAQKQRERQIALLETQAELATATGTNVQQINEWLRDPQTYAEEIKNAFLANNNFEELGELERKQLLEEFESKFGTYLAYAEVLPSLEQLAGQEWPESISNDVPDSLSNIEDQLGSIIGLLSDTDRLTAGLNSDAMTLKEFKEQGADAITARALSTDQGSTYTAKDFIDAEYTPQETKAAGFSAKEFNQSGVSYTDAKDAGFSKDELIDAGYSQAATHASSDVTRGTATSSTKKSKTAVAKDKYLKYLQGLAKTGTMNKATFSTVQSLANDAGLSARTYMQALANIDKPKNITWAQVIQAAKDNGFSMYRMALTFTSKAFQTGYDTVYGKGKYKKNRAYALKYPKKYSVYAYASGGLASKTGPAWLDGTPSKPELVLNAQDTKNFIALKDILAHAMGSTNNINNSYGGNATYEININVDHINNDYDVDKIAKRVKENIVKDSSYRNVTQVRKFR